MQALLIKLFFVRGVSLMTKIKSFNSNLINIAQNAEACLYIDVDTDSHSVVSLNGGKIHPKSI